MTTPITLNATVNQTASAEVGTRSTFSETLHKIANFVKDLFITIKNWFSDQFESLKSKLHRKEIPTEAVIVPAAPEQKPAEVTPVVNQPVVEVSDEEGPEVIEPSNSVFTLGHVLAGLSLASVIGLAAYSYKFGMPNVQSLTGRVTGLFKHS